MLDCINPLQLPQVPQVPSVIGPRFEVISYAHIGLRIVSCG